MDQNQRNNSTQMLLNKGSRLANRYLIQSGMSLSPISAIYKARDLRFPNVVKSVAVKEYFNPAPDIQNRQLYFENFERQVNLLATLTHPSLPGILDYFIQDRQAYLVLEFINGQTLASLLEKSSGRLSHNQVIPWAIGLCEMLQYLHEHQPEPFFVRDLNPSKLVLDQHNQILLYDFGLEANFHSDLKHAFAGSANYLAPELFLGQLDARVDIYSLGACLHRLVVGSTPPTVSESIKKQEMNGLPGELLAIIDKTIQNNPADRYQSAADLKSDMLDFIGRTESRKLAPQYNAVAPIPDNTIQPIWTFECADEIRGTALFHRGIVYFGSYDHHLYALNAETGKLLWKYQTDGGIVSRPAIAEDSVFIGSEDSRLHVLSARSGSLLWTYYTKGPIRSSPFVAHGHVFIGSDDMSLHAININGGRGIWQIDTIGEIRSTPFVTQEEIYAGNEAGEFYCMDFRGGIKWRYKAKRSITSSAFVANDAVFFCSLDSYIYALDARSGYLIWRFKMDKGSISSPFVVEQLLYCGSIDGNIYCVNTNNAKEVWRFKTENQVNSSPVIVEEQLFCGSVDGNIYCLDRQNGHLHWKYKTNQPITATPSVGGGRVYVGSTDKLLYALPAKPSN